MRRAIRKLRQIPGLLDEAGYAARPVQRDAVTTDAIHYGNVPDLTELDPRRYGQGMRGQEAARVAGHRRLSKRVYFYPWEQRRPFPQPESGVGPHIYATRLRNVYDLNADPRNLIGRMGRATGDQFHNRLELAIANEDFDGYLYKRDDGLGNVILIDPGPVPVVPYQPRAGQIRRPPVANRAPLVQSLLDDDTPDPDAWWESYKKSR